MKYPRSLRVALLLLTILISTAAVFAQDSIERWQKFDFARIALKPADLNGVALEDLTLMRGIVFGRHGRIFKDATINGYLTAQDWYKPNPDFQNSSLNGVENRNLDLIRDAEASKHRTVQPGDMRYWRTRLLTPKKLGVHSGAEWLVLRSEVEAIHGKRFEDAPWLKQYFNERSCYNPGDGYTPRGLSPTE